jgi:hypothetical protein
MLVMQSILQEALVLATMGDGCGYLWYVVILGVIHGVLVEHGWGTDMGEGEEVEKEKGGNQIQLILDV